MMERLRAMLAKPLVVGSKEQEEAISLATLLGVRLRFGETEVVSRLPPTEQDLKTPAMSESTATRSRSARQSGGSTKKGIRTPASWVERSHPE